MPERVCVERSGFVSGPGGNYSSGSKSAQYYGLCSKARETTTSVSTTTAPATTTKPLEAVMVRRLHKSGNANDYFAKTFAEYKTGFSSNGELWLGLDELHRLTTGGPYGLRVTMKDWDDKEYTAVYSNFQVGPGDDYVLSVSGFESSSSTLGDSMARHNGMRFSAKDRDVDTHSAHCSQTRGGG